MQELMTYLKMTRVHNVIPSLMLVMLGAWSGSGRNPAVLTSPLVWAMAAISSGVSMASMVINDYFDFRWVWVSVACCAVR